MKFHKPALVIGGGIAGPTAALALKRAGIDSIVFESHPAPAASTGGQIMVAPNGLAALRIVGVDLGAVGCPIHRMVIGDGSGRKLGEFPALQNLEPGRVVWRSALHSALNAELAAHDIPTYFGQRLVRIEERAQDITAIFEDGSTATGEVLIGADGIHSTVRHLMDPEELGPQYVGFLNFGGFARCSADRWMSENRNSMHFIYGRRAFFGFWPLDEGVAWFCNVPHPSPMSAAQAREVPTDEWLAKIRTLSAKDEAVCTFVRTTSADQLMVLGAGEILPSVRRWHRGRTVLVGDAAHAPSNSSGQGASLAVESSVELARCLRDGKRLSDCFAAYEHLRRPRVQKVAAYAAKQNQGKTLSPLARTLMNLLMPIMTKTVMTPERMFGWMHRYRIDWGQAALPDARLTPS